MSNMNFCFEKEFLPFFRRGGGGLVSESDIWGKLEKHFGRVYVPHKADGCIIQELYKMAVDQDAVFLMVVVGIPGAGKTQLLKELVMGLDPRNFQPEVKDQIKTIKEAFEFRDIGELKPSTRKRTGKRIVWITLSIDKFLGPGLEAKSALKKIEEKLGACLKKEGRESVIICGNVGAIGDIKDERAKSIRDIFDYINVRNYGKAKFIRVPSDYNFFWCKQFGIKADDSYQMSGDWESFQRYSIALFDLVAKYLKRCTKNGKIPECKECSAITYLAYIKELRTLIEDKDFIVRLHDLLQFLWLKHPDVFLTARTMNVFWGCTLTELWDLVKNVKNRGKPNRLLIYQALYNARISSIYKPREYSLGETGIHRFRDDKFEAKLLKRGLGISKKDANDRLQLRLEYFFERDQQYRDKIGSGAYSYFVDIGKLSSSMTEIAEKLALMRVDKSLIYSPEKSMLKPAGRLEELLLISKVIVRKEKGVLGHPLTVFDRTLGVSLGQPIFEEIQKSSYFLAHREKILKLNIRSEIGQILEVPRLHINLNDFIVLRSLISAVGQPDFSLYPSTRLKIEAFFDAINNIVQYLVKPALHKCILNRIKKNDKYGLRIRTLEPVKDCDVEIEGGKLKIKCNEEVVYEYPPANIS